jgi:hypothetical protein
MIEPRVRRVSDGRFALDLHEDERDLLRSVPEQLWRLLVEGDHAGDPALRRLYPSAYPEDAEAAREFDGAVRGDLTDQRMAAIDAMARTIDATGLSEDELLAWLGAINDVRLVLGVRLEVTEESEPEDFGDDEARAASFLFYRYLSAFEEDIVEALSGV